MILCATDAWFILCTNKIYTYVLKNSYFTFPNTTGSVTALMKLAGFSTSNKVKNHWSNRYTRVDLTTFDNITANVERKHTVHTFSHTTP